MREKKGLSESFRMVAVLAVICVLVAWLLSVVYAMTDGVYQNNVLQAKRQAVAALFDCPTVTTEELTLSTDGVQGAWSVYEDGALLGYCVNVNSDGFGGTIDMMVAASPNGTLLGVEIVSMSETPGLGSRVGDKAHLSQYEGLSSAQSAVLGQDVDAISGATISSKAVHVGVGIAQGALTEYLAQGGRVE